VNTWSDAARAASLAVRRRLAKTLAVGGTSAAGGIAGGLYGWLGGNIAASPLSKKVFESMSKGPQVDSKSYLKKLGETRVKVISSPEDITSEVDPKTRVQLIILAKLAEQGKFAGAARSKDGSEYMIVPAKTSAEVIDHELGHFRDQRKTKPIKGWEQGPIGAFTGRQLKRERVAWEEGGSKSDSEMKKTALKSYGRVATGTRVGTGLGALGGALYALKVLKAR
jgi:hypothetical protein